MAKKTRNQLKDLFKPGAKPSGDDFSDFIESTFNIQDDGLEKPVGADAPLKIISYGAEENLLDFYAGDSHAWRLNQKPSSAETPGLNFANAAGSSKLFIASSSGNVGVSTTNPKARLHILQSGNADALRIDDAKNDTTPLLIDKDGKVGIGTDSPDEKLEVNGNVKAAAFEGNLSSSKFTGTLHANQIPNLSATKITSGTLAGSLTVDSSSKGSGTMFEVKTQNESYFKVYNYPTSTKKRLVGEWHGGGNTGAQVRFSGVEDKGFIDIGQNSSGDFVVEGDDQARLVVQNKGNVGIGTTSPAAKLEVVGSGDTTVDLLVNGRIRSNNDNGGLWVSDDRFVGGLSTNKIGIYNNGAWRLTILNDGNVGIGTKSPSEKLDVAGNINLSGDLNKNSVKAFMIVAIRQRINNKITSRGTWKTHIKYGSDTAMKKDPDLVLTGKSFHSGSFWGPTRYEFWFA